MQLTQKETAYLQDAKNHEQLCVTKYTQFSRQVSDPQLAQILQTIAQQEQTHLQSINQLLQGQIPQTGGQSSSQQGSGVQGSMQSSGTGGSSTQSSSGSQSGMQVAGGIGFDDKTICTDLLTTEKAVSDMYQHAVFEFTNHQARQVIDHIGQEEHHHGYMLFDYMQQKGYYQPK